MAHNDWYHDGVEGGEDLWRLDLPDIQVQVFQVVGEDSYRMFIEHDVRDASGDVRIRYAGQDFPLDEDAAEGLLARSRQEVQMCLAAQIATVKGLPDQPEYH